MTPRIQMPSLQAELKQLRPDSAHCLSADLSDFLAVEQLLPGSYFCLGTYPMS